jgi:signal transduction histidine kinase
MLADLQLFGFSAAAVLETVLLVAMIERRNRRVVTLWMLLFTWGAWLWHTGLFVSSLLAETSGPWLVRLNWLAMIVMATGLLLIPSALLHGIRRLQLTGLTVAPPPRPALIVCYLPLLVVVPAALQLRTNPSAGFLPQLDEYIVPYIVWAAAVNSLSAIGLVRFRNSIAAPRMKEFFAWLGGALGVSALVLVFLFLFAIPRWPSAASPLTWFASMLPVVPALLFAYYVIRFQFVPLVLERTLVYGAIVVGLLLLYRLTLQDVTDRLTAQYHVDFGILEGGLAILLILIYQPLRQRIAESLRYLLGSRVATVRGRTRRLAVEMSEKAGRPPEELLTWFTAALTETLHAEFVAGWLMTFDGIPSSRGGHTSVMSDDDVQRLHADLSAAGQTSCSLHEAPTPAAFECLSRVRAALALRIDHSQIKGLVVIGPLPWQRQLGEEQLNFLLLLLEQFGSTIHNSQLLAERQAAESRAFQSEKLATLGLLAGSLAHEIKNPLSSIKTIATVVSEQLGPESPHQEDLCVILGEIDRLAATTTQLLEFARPLVASDTRGSVPLVLDRLVRLLRLLARQKMVTLEVQIEDQLPAVQADEQTLREIFFNLLSNSIEATGAGGRVCVDCRRDNGSVVTSVSDNGSGIPPALSLRVFEPFITTKETGTGLGLYVVSRRVREAGGEIHCSSDPQNGTRFVVRLPCERSHPLSEGGPNDR